MLWTFHGIEFLIRLAISSRTRHLVFVLIQTQHRSISDLEAVVTSYPTWKTTRTPIQNPLLCTAPRLPAPLFVPRRVHVRDRDRRSINRKVSTESWIFVFWTSQPLYAMSFQFSNWDDVFALKHRIEIRFNIVKKNSKSKSETNFFFEISSFDCVAHQRIVVDCVAVDSAASVFIVIFLISLFLNYEILLWTIVLRHKHTAIAIYCVLSIQYRNFSLVHYRYPLL